MAGRKKKRRYFELEDLTDPTIITPPDESGGDEILEALDAGHNLHLSGGVPRAEGVCLSVPDERNFTGSEIAGKHW